MATVLVTGGSGFIGSHIVAKLQKGGHRVIILSRNPARARVPISAGVEVRTGDVRKSEGLRAAMTGVDVVVNAVQFPNHPVENPRKGYTYMEVDGHGTVRQVEAARAAGVKQFIYISGAGTRPGQTSPWFQAKLKAEAAVRESGMAWTIIRPSWVYGPEDRSLNKFVAFARYLPFIPVIGSGRTRVSPVFVEDLATLVAGCAGAEKAHGKVYELGGPQELTMDEIIRTMLKVMGRRRPLVHHPAWFMKLATIPMQVLPAPPLSPAAVDFVLMEEPVDNSAALRDFNLKLTPLEQGLSYLRP